MNERSFLPLAGQHSPLGPGAQTRLRVLESAYLLFLRQGYHGTSMRQIAREAGVSPAAIYNHFPSKEAIFTTLLIERMPQRAIAVALGKAAGSDSEALVQDGLRRMGEAMVGQYQNWRLSVIELMEFQGHHGAAAAAEVMPEIIGFVERLQSADGRLKPLSPVVIGRAFMGLFVSYVITAMFFQGISGLEVDPSDIQALGDIFLHGVLRASV
jgi:AcrR family transcriptional regulator